MKILAVIGSPTAEKGFTERTVRVLERSIVQQADARFEYLYLERLRLPLCQGHLTCIKHGEHQCPYSAAIGAPGAAMAGADAVIFASPVHCFNVSALMKNFFDLFVYQMHRPSFFGKPAVVVTTAAGAGQKGVLKYMRRTIANWGFDVVGQLGTHGGLFDEARYQARLVPAADRLAATLIESLARDDAPKPGIAELINFRVWRSVVNRSKEASPYDWQHWQANGWLEQDYYLPVRVNAVSNGLASLVEKMIERAIRKVSVSPVT